MNIRVSENMSSDLSDREEDYLRAILEIVEEKGYSRIKDIAQKLGITSPSVVEMIKKLDDKKLVSYERYGGVTLTPEGQGIAQMIRDRHDTFRKFLEIILVPKETALKDAHILEHQLDPKTILQFNRFVDFITSTPERPRFVSRWMEMFKQYCSQKADSLRE
jgi:DtxR family Mn-dependent transcriptional regulator